MSVVQTQHFTALTLSYTAVLADYRLAYASRQASLLGRKEVLTGKAKFGIFGDGKELPQVALARLLQPGDVRSGYYRDQTLLMALGLTDVRKFFAQLYADTDPAREPASGGRQMNAHFGHAWLHPDGTPRDLTKTFLTSADISPTAGQMPRMLGLAQASKLYRNLETLQAGDFRLYSDAGNEIVVGTIGDASTSEGLFWETMNAAGVLQVPLLMNVWDDNYGISVPIEHQTVKGSISKALAGFHPKKKESGVHIFTVKGWDYPALLETYREAVALVRAEHVPALVHVQELTQPQGHSTSGSHERYKSRERLQWEQDHDGLARFRQWILDERVASEEALQELEAETLEQVKADKQAAWEAYQAPIKTDVAEVVTALQTLAGELSDGLTDAQPDAQASVKTLAEHLGSIKEPLREDALKALGQALVVSAAAPTPARDTLLTLQARLTAEGDLRYNSHLYSETPRAAVRVPEVPPVFAESETILGYELLQQSFTAFFEEFPNTVAFGEDLGQIGDVNQGFKGLQEKFGVERVFDTGIREATIIGQGIGLAMRGLRPIAEVQYLDYMLYAVQILSDDLATLRWRTLGGQAAPLIVRTRGHRLEGIWHSGSPLGMLLNALRGMYVCVPRNCTQAAGMYRTLLLGDDPGLVVEVLNGYRLREAKPQNIGQYTVPLGVPEVLRPGKDLTLVTYGALVRIAQDAAADLAALGVDVELIDVQTLLPFDRTGVIGASLRKTNRLVIVDEDVPGGASAFILKHLLEDQDGYRHLDSKPVTLTAHASRPAYASDGDYFSKPQRTDIVAACYRLLQEFNPAAYPARF